MFGTLFAVLIIVIRLGVCFRFRQIQRRQKLAGGAGKGKLILLDATEFSQGCLGVWGQGVAPQVQDSLRRCGYCFTGHTFPREQRERGGNRKLLLPCHAIIALGFAFLGQLGAQIGGDAGHVAGTDDFDPCLLDGVVGVLCFPPAGHTGLMHRIVMMTQPQGQSIRGAAQLGHLTSRQGPGGQRQAGALPGNAGGARLERHLDIRNLSDRAQHASGGALELLRAGVLFIA